MQDIRTSPGIGFGRNFLQGRLKHRKVRDSERYCRLVLGPNLEEEAQGVPCQKTTSENSFHGGLLEVAELTLPSSLEFTPKRQSGALHASKGRVVSQRRSRMRISSMPSDGTPRLAGMRRPSRWRTFYEQCLVIDPRTSMFLEVWDIVVFAVTVMVAFLAPYEAAFIHEPSRKLVALDDLVYCIFLWDMALQMCVAQPDPDRPSCMVKAPCYIIKRYAAGWLVIDSLALLPYLTWVFFRACGYSTHVLGRLMRLLGLCRLLKLPRLIDRLGFLRRWQIVFGFSFALLEVLKYLCYVACVCHWMACLWGGISISFQEEEHTWLRKLAKDKGVTYEFYEGHLYGIALYWAVMTLTSVGYGDIAPQNPAEYWAASLCMAVAASLWAFMIGEVCRIAASVDPHQTRFMQTMDDLNYLLKSRGMPGSTRRSMRAYLYEARELSRQRAQGPVLEQMSPMLQGQMAMQLHRPWLERVWYLRDMQGQAMVSIARRLLADFFAPNEEVPSKRTLFMLRRGLCLRRAKILMKGDVWGEDMVLTNPVLRDDAPVKALAYLEVVMLPYEDLMEAVKGFPEVVDQIHRVKVKIAVARGIILVARAIRDLLHRNDWDRDDITEEAEQYLVHTVLAGGNDRRVSSTPVPRKQTRTKRVSMEEHQAMDQMPRLSRSNPLYALQRSEQDERTPDMQTLIHAVGHLSEKIDSMERGRASRYWG